MTRTYTPLFDDITQEHGIVTSAVYGYMWRQCQKERGVCCASFQTIADDLDLSRRTVINHINKLKDADLIIDTTPNKGTKPHDYLVNDMHQASEIDSPTSELNALLSEIDSLALVQEIHRTSELNAPKDTRDNKRNKLRDKEKYIYDPMLEAIQPIRTALNAIIKRQTDKAGFDDVLFINTAEILHGRDATPEQVIAFGEWWKSNGFYDDTPVCKNLVNNWADFLSGKNLKNKPSPNGNLNGHGQPKETAEERYARLFPDDVKDVIKR